MPIIVIVILIIMNGKLTKDILLSGSPYIHCFQIEFEFKVSAFAYKEPKNSSLVFALSSWKLGFSFFYIFDILAYSGCLGFLEGRISFSIIFLYFPFLLSITYISSSYGNY